MPNLGQVLALLRFGEIKSPGTLHLVLSSAYSTKSAIESIEGKTTTKQLQYYKTNQQEQQ